MNTNKIRTASSQIGRLTIALTFALTLALGANLAYGQWVNPPATPPSQNVATPINVSANAQTKGGMLTTATTRAADQVRSDMYCDYQGANCFTGADVVNIINNYNADTPDETVYLSTPVSVTSVQGTHTIAMGSYASNVKEVYMRGTASGCTTGTNEWERGFSVKAKPNNPAAPFTTLALQVGSGSNTSDKWIDTRNNTVIGEIASEGSAGCQFASANISIVGYRCAGDCE